MRGQVQKVFSVKKIKIFIVVVCKVYVSDILEKGLLLGKKHN